MSAHPLSARGGTVSLGGSLPGDPCPHEAVQARDAQPRPPGMGILVVRADVIEVVAVVENANRGQPALGRVRSEGAVGHAESKTAARRKAAWLVISRSDSGRR